VKGCAIIGVEVLTPAEHLKLREKSCFGNPYFSRGTAGKSRLTQPGYSQTAAGFARPALAKNFPGGIHAGWSQGGPDGPANAMRDFTLTSIAVAHIHKIDRFSLPLSIHVRSRSVCSLKQMNLLQIK